MRHTRARSTTTKCAEPPTVLPLYSTMPPQPQRLPQPPPGHQGRFAPLRGFTLDAPAVSVVPSGCRGGRGAVQRRACTVGRFGRRGCCVVPLLRVPPAGVFFGQPGLYPRSNFVNLCHRIAFCVLGGIRSCKTTQKKYLHCRCGYFFCNIMLDVNVQAVV